MWSLLNIHFYIKVFGFFLSILKCILTSSDPDVVFIQDEIKDASKDVHTNIIHPSMPIDA